MPKELFFALTDEKQSRIIESALIEFSNKTYNEASINQVIKVANISRGSFYQYFVDKEDVYFFIINKVIESTSGAFILELKEKQPINIFFIYKELFVYNLKMISDERYKSFFRNMYLSMNYEFQQKLRGVFSKIRNDILSNKTSNIIKDMEKDKRYFIELMNILELINRDLLTMKIVDNLDDKCIMEIYELRMRILCDIKNI